MSFLNEIKKKIKVVESTSKITNAMKLIASSKLKKQKDLHIKTSNYFLSVYELFGTICESVDKKILLNKPINNNTIWIIFTSSMGLCGSYNLNVVKKLAENILSNDEIIIFGKKGINLLKTKNISNNIIGTINFDDKEINYDTFEMISEKLVNDYYDNKFKNVKIIYTKFINSLMFEPTIFELLPFNKDNLKRIDKPVNGSYFQIEPSGEKIFNFMLTKYLSSVLLGTVVESKISENASRRNAMEGATKNANELNANYKLEFNRIRQADITQEITEIISGSKVGE